MINESFFVNCSILRSNCKDCKILILDQSITSHQGRFIYYYSHFYFQHMHFLIRGMRLALISNTHLVLFVQQSVRA